MKQRLHDAISDVLSQLNISLSELEIQLEKPKVAEHGDLATNIAMVLARSLGTNPRALAQNIIELLNLDGRYIQETYVAGPGFINFRFSHEWLIEALGDILHQGVAYGRLQANAGKKANVEWVSANPTGPLHAGHGRQVCIGAMLCSLLEWTGWAVTREYYFNNAGNQMQNLARSVRERYKELCGLAVVEEEIHYAGEYIHEIARSIWNEHGESKLEAPIEFFSKQGETWCFASIQRTLVRLGVRHDVFFNEDSLYSDGSIDALLSELREKGLSYQKDGAVWLKTTEFGAEKDRVIVKNTGEPTYRLPDIAYHRNKILRGYDKVIDIFGADHIATIPDVLATVRALGLPSDNVDVIIHQMVSFVNEGETVKMSKRSGNVYSLDDLIEEVGEDAVRYFFVMRGARTHLEFDIELAKEQSENNPVYYLQYAHARIASILRFAESEGVSPSDDTELSLLTHESEIALIKTLLDFPDVVAASARTYETQHLCTYLHGVAALFHKFYHDCRVVTENRSMTAARLALCQATRQVLANGFSIIGITAPESM